MDIKVRNLDKSVIEKIDELASAEGVSRNDYLRKRIIAMAVLEDVDDIEIRYRQHTDRIIREVSSLADTVRTNNELLQLLLDQKGTTWTTIQ